VRICADISCGYADPTWARTQDALIQARHGNSSAYSFASIDVSGTANSALINGLPIALPACFIVRGKSELGFGATSANETCIYAQNKLRQSCAAGTFFSSEETASAFTCVKCIIGTVSASGGASACALCESGSFTAATGLTACQDCAAGTFLASNQSTATECGKCNLGKVSASGGASACASCESGSFTAATGLTACQDCEPGLFLAVDVHTTCTKCETGRYSSGAGETTCDSCAGLAAGRYTPAAGATHCAVCPADTHSVPANVLLDSPSVERVCAQCPAASSKLLSCNGGIIRWEPKAWYDFEKTPAHLIGPLTEIHRCFNDESCTRSDAGGVACATSKGYYGPLCGACDREKGFIRSGFGCKECWETVYSYLGSAGLVVAFVAMVGWFTVAQDFDRPRDDYSGVVLKMLFSHLQVRPAACVCHPAYFYHRLLLSVASGQSVRECCMSPLRQLRYPPFLAH